MCGPLASTQLFFHLVRKVWLITSCRKGGIITRLKGSTDEIILGHVHVAVVAAPSR